MASAATDHGERAFEERRARAAAAEAREVALRVQAAHLHAGTARLVALLDEVAVARAWEGAGIRSLAHWATIELGVDLAAGRRLVALGEALRDLPEVRAAFAEGRLSEAKATIVARVAEADVSGSQAHWLEVAAAATATQLARIAAVWEKVVADPDEGERARSRRGLWWRSEGALVRLTVLLEPAEAAVVHGSIQRHADERWRAEHADGGDGDGPEPGSEAELAADERVAGADDPAAARAADALVSMAETDLAHLPASRAGADRHRVVLHLDAEALAGYDPLDPSPPVRRGRCHLRDGTRIDAPTARRLACDCTITPLIRRDGRPVDLGRDHRLVDARLRRLVEARDGGCAFPGCTSTRHLDVHHIHHWLDGGRTDLDNLVALCRHHHVRHHAGDHTIRPGAERGDGPTFHRPDGTPLRPPAPTALPPDDADAGARPEVAHRHVRAGDGGAPLRVDELSMLVDATLSVTGRCRR